MHWLFVIFKVLPAMTIPASFIAFELGWSLLRKRNKGHYICWLLGVTLMGVSVTWFALRGDKNSERWIRDWDSSLTVSSDRL